MKKLLMISMMALMINTANATPWARDCVRWWGGAIPEQDRTAENCPNGYSHWDAPKTLTNGEVGPQASGATEIYNQTYRTSGTVNSNVRSIVTNSGTYVIIPNHSSGGIGAVLRSGK